MAVTWDDFNLSAGQKALAQEYEAIANLPSDEQARYVPTPTQTSKQSTTVDRLSRDYITLMGKAQRGAQIVIRYHEKAALEQHREEAGQP